MLESVAVIGLILGMIRPQMQQPFPQPYQYPTQPYYYPQEQYSVPQVTQGNYPTQYQTPLGTRNWSQAGSQPYGYGQQTQTPKNSLWR